MVLRTRIPFTIVKRTRRTFQSAQWRISKILLNSTNTGWLNRLVSLLTLSKKMVRTYASLVKVEDDDIHKRNAMNKLDADSIHIMESDDDDEQILFECQNKKETRQRRDIPQEKPKDKLPKVPSYYGK